MVDLDESPAGLRRVRVDDVPALTLVRADEYHTDLLRELQLIRLGTASGVTGAQEDLWMVERAESALGWWVDVWGRARAQADAALQRGQQRCTVELDLPLEIASAARDLMRFLDEFEEFAQTCDLLTMPPSAEVVSWKRRWLTEVVRQLEQCGAAPAANAFDVLQARDMGEPGRQHSGGPDEKAARRRCARTRFAPKPSAPRLVRALLRNILQDWNASDLADRAELPVTELVTNAVLHARTEVEVVVKLDPYALRIEVHDHSTSPPLRQPHDLDAGTGHGLKLVAACANRWGVAPTTTGKAVWFELDRP